MIKLWNAQTGKLIYNFANENVEAKDLFKRADAIFSPDGKYILSRDLHSVKLWNIETKKVKNLFTVPEGKAIYDINYTPDGERLISIESHLVKIRDAKTGNLIQSHESKNLESIYSAHISSNGKYLLLKGSSHNIFGKKKYLEMWELDKWNHIKTYKSKSLNRPGLQPGKLAFHPSGKEFISVNKYGNIVFWRSDSKKPIKTIDDPANYKLQCVSYSPDESLLATGDDAGNIKIWDLSNGKTIINLNKSKSKTAKEVNIDYSPDGKKLLTSIDHNIKIFNIENGELIDEQGKGKVDFVSKIMVGKDEKSLINIINSKAIGKLDLTKKDQLISYIKKERGIIRDLSVSQNEQYILSGSTENKHVALYLRKYSDGSVIKEYKRQKIQPNHTLMKVGISPNSEKLYSMSYIINSESFMVNSGYTYINIWKKNNNEKPEKNYRFGKIAGNLVFSPDAKFAALFQVQKMGPKFLEKRLNEDWGMYFTLWNLSKNSVKSYPLKGTEKYSDKLGLCYSPDNRNIAIGEGNGTIRIFNISNKEFTINSKIFNKSISNISYSNDGKYIFAASGSIIKMLDAKTLEEKNRFDNNTLIADITNFPKSKNIVSSGTKGEIQIWSYESGKKILSLYGFNKFRDWVALSPDGKFYGTKEGMKNLHYVKGTQVIPLESFFEKGYTPNLVQSVLQNKDISGEGINLADLKNPPSVTISSPENYAKSDSRESKVIVKATDQGGGIDEIRLYHNGKLVQNTQRGFKKVEKANEEITKTFTVQLVKGQNEIKATAFNNQRTESIPDRVSVMYEGPRSESELYLITVGINKYKNPKYNLNYALSDAKSFEEKVKQGGESIFRDIQTYFISDNQATKANIEATFNKIQQKAGPEDVFIFYYAGHGVMSQEKDPQFYLAPYEVTQLYGNNALLQSKGLSAEYLQNKSREIAARKQLFIMDACQSGGMVDHLAMRGAAEEKAVAQLARSTGTYWLTASGSEQFATEFKTLGHGLFTHSILMGLQGDADGGAKDGKITVKEISSFLNDMVPELSTKHKGEPQYPNTYGYGQDFPVVIVK